MEARLQKAFPICNLSTVDKYEESQSNDAERAEKKDFLRTAIARLCKTGSELFPKGDVLFFLYLDGMEMNFSKKLIEIGFNAKNDFNAFVPNWQAKSMRQNRAGFLSLSKRNQSKFSLYGADMNDFIHIMPLAAQGDCAFQGLDAVWLDWCCTLKQNEYSTLENIFNYKLLSQSRPVVFAFTVSVSRDQGPLLVDARNGIDREDSIDMRMQSLFRRHGYFVGDSHFERQGYNASMLTCLYILVPNSLAHQSGIVDTCQAMMLSAFEKSSLVFIPTQTFEDWENVSPKKTSLYLKRMGLAPKRTKPQAGKAKSKTRRHRFIIKGTRAVRVIPKMWKQIVLIETDDLEFPELEAIEYHT